MNKQISVSGKGRDFAQKLPVSGDFLVDVLRKGIRMDQEIAGGRIPNTRIPYVLAEMVDG